MRGRKTLRFLYTAADKSRGFVKKTAVFPDDLYDNSFFSLKSFSFLHLDAIISV